MTTVKRSALVPYRPQEMFALVNDVARYPEFLQWCKASKIISQTNDEIVASLTLGKAGIEKTFTTRNRLHPNKMIEIQLLNGPFKHLNGFWQFEDLYAKGTRITLDLSFELSGQIFDIAFGPIFTQIANTLVASFCKRALEIYSLPNE